MTATTVYSRIAAAINAQWPSANAFEEFNGCIHINPENQPLYVLGDINETWGYDIYPTADAYATGDQPEPVDLAIPRESQDAPAIARAFLAHVLARKFSAVLHEHIGTAQVRLAILRNREYEKRYPENTPCASQDFCDANMTMLEAFQTLGVLNGPPEDDDAVALWNQSWDIARANRFFTAA